jgi:uncharacterized C2H2 Zn-finger protein
MAENDEEPVVCSKCNTTFPTDSEYLQHYNQEHTSQAENAR